MLKNVGCYKIKRWCRSSENSPLSISSVSSSEKKLALLEPKLIADIGWRPWPSLTNSWQFLFSVLTDEDVAWVCSAVNVRGKGVGFVSCGKFLLIPLLRKYMLKREKRFEKRDSRYLIISCYLTLKPPCKSRRPRIIPSYAFTLVSFSTTGVSCSMNFDRCCQLVLLFAYKMLWFLHKAEKIIEDLSQVIPIFFLQPWSTGFWQPSASLASSFLYSFARTESFERISLDIMSNLFAGSFVHTLSDGF